MSLLETPGHSQTSLGQFPVGSLLLSGSLWAQDFVYAIQASLVSMGFDSKCDFTPPTILMGAFPLPLDVGYLFLVGFSILLLMIVQQWVVILEFSQEKMSSCPSTPPSWLFLASVYKIGNTLGFQKNPQKNIYSISSTLGRHLRGSHAIAVTTFADCPIPFPATTTSTSTKQLMLTNNNQLLVATESTGSGALSEWCMHGTFWKRLSLSSLLPP